MRQGRLWTRLQTAPTWRRSCLQRTTYHGHEAVVRVLLGAGASVCKATSEDIRDGARVLLSKGSTSLSIAEVRGHAAVVTLLRGTANS